MTRQQLSPLQQHFAAWRGRRGERGALRQRARVRPQPADLRAPEPAPAALAAPVAAPAAAQPGPIAAAAAPAAQAAPAAPPRRIVGATPAQPQQLLQQFVDAQAAGERDRAALIRQVVGDIDPAGVPVPGGAPGLLGAGGQAAMEDAAAAHRRAEAAAIQQLRAGGLGISTILAAVQRGAAGDLARQQAAIREAQAGRMAGALMGMHPAMRPVEAVDPRLMAGQIQQAAAARTTPVQVRVPPSPAAVGGGVGAGAGAGAAGRIGAAPVAGQPDQGAQIIRGTGALTGQIPPAAPAAAPARPAPAAPAAPAAGRMWWDTFGIPAQRTTGGVTRPPVVQAPHAVATGITPWLDATQAQLRALRLGQGTPVPAPAPPAVGTVVRRAII